MTTMTIRGIDDIVADALKNRQKRRNQRQCPDPETSQRETGVEKKKERPPSTMILITWPEPGAPEMQPTSNKLQAEFGKVDENMWGEGSPSFYALRNTMFGFCAGKSAKGKRDADPTSRDSFQKKYNRPSGGCSRKTTGSLSSWRTWRRNGAAIFCSTRTTSNPGCKMSRKGSSISWRVSTPFRRQIQRVERGLHRCQKKVDEAVTTRRRIPEAQIVIPWKCFRLTWNWWRAQDGETGHAQEHARPSGSGRICHHLLRLQKIHGAKQHRGTRSRQGSPRSPWRAWRSCTPQAGTSNSSSPTRLCRRRSRQPSWRPPPPSGKKTGPTVDLALRRQRRRRGRRVFLRRPVRLLSPCKTVGHSGEIQAGRRKPFHPALPFLLQVKGFPYEEMIMAVGVLAMVDASSGGVLYTRTRTTAGATRCL